MKSKELIILNIILILSIISMALSSHIKAQSNCNNLDFEDGSFNNWIGYTGYMWTIDTFAIPGIVNGRHTITSGSSTDPNTNNNISIVAPGSNYSCKLGNSMCGAEAEKLEYTFRVSDSSALFIYQYAVVFEDPGHDPEHQPQFEITILDSVGICIDSSCGYYQVTSAGNIPGFSSYNTIMYKDWTTVGMDLTSYIGQEITISFTTKDCGHGGHFGYAYIDASFQPMELMIKACSGLDSITLSAPYGFADYLWLPGNITDREFKIPASQAGDQFECILTSVTGCQVTLNTSTEITILEPDFSAQSCDITEFTDLSHVENGEISEWIWNFNETGNNTNITDPNPIYYFQEPGIHDISLTIVTRSGCQASISKPVPIYTKPYADFDFKEVCFGDTTKFYNTTLVEFADTIQYIWDFGDGNRSTEANPTYTFNTAENNYVKLKAKLTDYCFATITKEVDTKQCQVMLPNVMTPNNDLQNELFYIQNLDFYPTNKLIVYNRWGVVMYEAENYRNDWIPEKINPGVYYYIFSYLNKYNDGEIRTETGFLNIFANK